MKDAVESIEEDLTFWPRTLEALGFEARLGREINGVSGLVHSVLAVGVDEKRGAICLVSNEVDARSAALMQVDIQQTFNDSTKVLVVRPIVLDFNNVAREFIENFGGFEYFTSLFKEVKSKDNSEINEIIRSSIPSALFQYQMLRGIPVSGFSQFVGLARQVVDGFSAAMLQEDLGGSELEFSVFDNALKRIAESDYLKEDRELGLCAFPISQIEEKDIDKIIGVNKENRLEEVLNNLGVSQYFRPPVDHFSMGMVDRNHVSRSGIHDTMELSQNMGHPISDPGFIDKKTKPFEIIDALVDRDLIVEGEFGMELTEKGEVIRASVKFKPREGVISKISNRISVSLNISEFFK